VPFPAAQTDAQFVSPWGMSYAPGGPFRISENGSGNTTVVNGNTGTEIAVAGNASSQITIAPPAGQTSPAAPTGQVFNASGNGLTLSQGGKSASAPFLFATEDGTISGWNPAVDPAQSVLAVDNSQAGNGAVSKGLAIATTASGSFLYAFNFHEGTVDMFDQNFKQVGSFTDQNVPAGYAPFNVQVLGGHLYVTFAQQDAEKHDDVAGAGHGFVDKFDLSRHLVQRIASNGVLKLFTTSADAISMLGFSRRNPDVFHSPP